MTENAVPILRESMAIAQELSRQAGSAVMNEVNAERIADKIPFPLVPLKECSSHRASQRRLQTRRRRRQLALVRSKFSRRKIRPLVRPGFPALAQRFHVAIDINVFKRSTPSLTASAESSYLRFTVLKNGHRNGSESALKLRFPTGDLISNSFSSGCEE